MQDTNFDVPEIGIDIIQDDGQSYVDIEDDNRDLPSEIKTMDAIHKTFSNVISEFRGDKSAEKFMEEYEKLYEALKLTHKELKQWQLRCNNLANEIKNNTEKVNLAIHLSQEDRGMIAALNKQVADAWEMVDVLHDRELKAKDAVASMKEEMSTLTDLVEEGMGLDELKKLSDKASSERESMEKIIKEIKEERDVQEARTADIITKLKGNEQKLESTIAHYKGVCHELKVKAEDDKVKREEDASIILRLERIKNALKYDKEKLELDVEDRKKKETKLEEKARDNKLSSEAYQRKYKNERTEHTKLKLQMRELEDKYRKLEVKKKNKEEAVAALNVQLTYKQHDMDIKTHELQQKEAMLTYVQNQNQTFSSKLVKTQQVLSNCEADKLLEQNVIKIMENHIHATTNELESVATVLKNTLSILEIKEMAFGKLKKQKETVETNLVYSVGMNQRLNKNLTQCTDKIKEAFRNIKSLGLDKDQLNRTINLHLSEIERLNNIIKSNETSEMMLRKYILDLENTLKPTREQLTVALNQRDNAVRQLRRTELANSDLTIANINIGKQTTSLADEMLTKERTIDKMNEKLLKVTAELNTMTTELNAQVEKNKKLKDINDITQTDLRYTEALMFKMEKQIDRLNLSKQELMHQRNTLGAIVVRDRQEKDMMMEKHQILTNVMNIGNKLYNERIREIKFLHMENANLLRQKMIVNQKVVNIDTLRSKLGLANQQLVSYKARCCALEDQAPVTLHKWKILKSQDESKYELIVKNNYLLKRLIGKTDEVTKLNGIIMDKCLVLNHLKGLLAKAPGPEVAVKANLDRKAKEGTTRKLKAALAEMNMVEWKAQDAEEEKKKLKIELAKERKEKASLQKKLLLPPIDAPRQSWRGHEESCRGSY